MATITNQATLSYNGGSTNSNIATAELVETLALTKPRWERAMTPSSGE